MATIDPALIPIYPESAYIARSFNLTDNPYVCEDDHGRLSFLSEQARDAYIEWCKNVPKGGRSCQGRR